MVEWYELIIPLASLITASVALATVHYLRKELKISRVSFEKSSKSYEAEVVLRIEEKFQKTKGVLLSITSSKPIHKDLGGEFDDKDLYEFLSVLDLINTFLSNGLISEEVVKRLYGQSIVVTCAHDEIKEYVRLYQEKYPGAWGGIMDMAKKFSKS